MSRERFCPRLRKYASESSSAVFVKYNCLDKKLNVLTLNSCQGSTPFTKRGQDSAVRGVIRVRELPPFPKETLSRLRPVPCGGLPR